MINRSGNKKNIWKLPPPPVQTFSEFYLPLSLHLPEEAAAWQNLKNILSNKLETEEERGRGTHERPPFRPSIAKRVGLTVVEAIP